MPLRRSEPGAGLGVTEGSGRWGASGQACSSWPGRIGRARAPRRPARSPGRPERAVRRLGLLTGGGRAGHHRPAPSQPGSRAAWGAADRGDSDRGQTQPGDRQAGPRP